MSEINGWEDIAPADRAALTALCMEYVWRVDNGQTATIGELFTDDGVWENGPTAMRGTAELVEGWAKRAAFGLEGRRRHMIANLRFRANADGTVNGWINFVLYKAPEGSAEPAIPQLVADHVDVYAKDGAGKWRFKYRRMDVILPASWKPR